MKRLAIFTLLLFVSFSAYACDFSTTDSQTTTTSTIVESQPTSTTESYTLTTLHPTTNISAFFNLEGMNFLLPSTPFSLHSMISDDVVFQQGKEIRVFGTAEAGTIILVKLTLDKMSSSAWMSYQIVPENGQWVVTLPALEASFDTYTLTVSDTINEVIVKDCLVGEIWLVSGQSNMEMKISEMDLGYELFGSINEEYIRVFTEERLNNNASFSYLPRYDVIGGMWSKASSYDKISGCSGIGFSFAYKLFYTFLQQGKQVPVAMINTPIGGSKIQSWLSRDEVVSSSVLTTYVEQSGYAIDESGWNSMGWNNFNQVSANYNEKIAPLTNFNIKGVAWYQGESDPVYEENIIAIESLITSWSQAFNQNDELLYFAMIQIAPYDGADPLTTVSSNWYLGFANQRRAQYDIATNPRYSDHVLLVPIYDIDLKWDVPTTQFLWADPIHPVTKLPVGQRLSNMVMSFVYLQNEEYLSPMVSHVTLNDNSIIVTFDYVGEGLVLLKNTTSIKTVEVIYSNGIKVSATATIISTNQIEITGINVSMVKYVCYSNLSRNETSNLASSKLIPATPFVYEVGDNN